MGYRFLFGPSGAGKSRLLHTRILEKADPSSGDGRKMHDNYVIIVPDQYSMQTQKEIVTESRNKGILNIDVLSFGRLTHRIFEETGVSDRAVLDETGKTLLMRRAAGKCEQELTILKKSIHYPGMISEIKSVISEFMQYGIGSEELSAMQKMAEDHGQGALRSRLEDLAVLYEAFIQGKKDRYITSEERLDLLAEAIPASGLVRRSVFILDGFTGFTPVQYRVIAALIRCSKDVVIALTLGNDGGKTMEWVHEHKSPGKEDALYYLTRKTVCDLDMIAEREGLTRKSDLTVGEKESTPFRFMENPVLAHLERHIFRYPAVPFRGESEGRIEITEADTPEEEVRQICIRIKKLVLTEGYQYRNISAVCGDLEQYGKLFEKQAAGYGIPVYIDKTSSTGLNPLTESVRSVLQIRPQGYSYSSVFRYLRSGMSGLTQEETDILENYCLRHGIRGRKKWSLPFDADTEPLRIRFLSEIEPAAGEIGLERMPVLTAAERTEALYRFLTGVRAEEKMEEWTKSFHDAGDYVREKQFGQLYRSVIALMDLIHDLIGEETVSAPEYAELLDAGFSQIRLGTLPQQADRVLIGDIERTRLSECRILFLAGVNDGNIPRGKSRGGLLSDLDREFLRSSGAELSPTPRQQMYIQRLYLYMNMTKPTDRLLLSYARTNPEGGALHASYLIQMIRKLFPDAETVHPQDLPVSEQLTAEKDSVVWLSGALRDYARGRTGSGPDPENVIQTTYGYLMREGDRETALRLDALKEAAFTKYDPVWISGETARKLYGNTVAGSVSRLETAAKCSLYHFLKYGLRLLERKEYVVDASDAGSILHQSLDRFSRKLASKGVGWTEFTPEQGKGLISESLRETAAVYNDQVMHSTVRSEYQLARMERILQRSVDTLQYQLMKGDFVPASYEFRFGRGGEAEAIRIPLTDGRQLLLEGRIDRIDLCREDGNIFVKILDYKSGSVKLDEEMMRRGLQLQLIIYMNAVMNLLAAENPGSGIIPSAMMYYQIKDPVISVNEAKSDADASDTDSKIKAELKPGGMVDSEEISYQHLHRGYRAGMTSDVMPLKLNKNGTISDNSSVYTTQEFIKLSGEVREVICSLAEEILSGKASADPAVWESGKKAACDYCPYRNVCGFDPSIEGYEYRKE